MPNRIFINDCRKDIRNEKRSMNDKKSQNIFFAKVLVNGWPSIFVITNRLIKKDSELLGFYGVEYYKAVREKELQNHIRTNNANIIDQKIIQSQIQINDIVDLS